MRKIDIEQIDDISETLEELHDEESLCICEDGVERYIVIPTKVIEEVNNFMNGESQVRVVSDEPINITYDEYENLKKQLNKAIDETFRPKPEKLN